MADDNATGDVLQNIIVTIVTDDNYTRITPAKQALMTLSTTVGNRAPVRYHKENGNTIGVILDGTNLTVAAVRRALNGCLGEDYFDIPTPLRHVAPQPSQESQAVHHGFDPIQQGDWGSLVRKLTDTESERARACLRGDEFQAELEATKAEVEVADHLLSEISDEAKRATQGVATVASKLGLPPPGAAIFMDADKSGKLVQSLCSAVESMQARGQGMMPDPEAEFVDVSICYLIGYSDNKGRVSQVTAALEKHGVGKARSCVGGGTVRKFGDLAGKIDAVLVELGFTEKAERCAAEARIRQYFTAERYDDWSPELWDDDKEVSFANIALAYRITAGAASNAINRTDAEPARVDLQKRKFYRWGDIKGYFETRSRSPVKLPEPVGQQGIKPATDDEVWDMAQNLDRQVQTLTAQLNAERERTAELSSRLAGAGGTDENLTTTEQHLLRAYQGMNQDATERAIAEYNRIFPNGMPEDVRTALLPLADFISREMGDTLRTIEGAYTNEGLDLDAAKRVLGGYNISFEDSEYSHANKDSYEDSLVTEPEWRFKNDEELSAEQRTEKEIIKDYDAATIEHDQNARAAKGLLDRINALEEWHEACVDTTREWREKNLPINAMLMSFSYVFREQDDSGDDSHVLRIVLPVTDENIREELALSFAYHISRSLHGREDFDIRPGEILGCKCIDLVYKEDITEKAAVITYQINSYVNKSEISRAGIRTNIQHIIGEVPEHGR